ncbi:NAD(P)-dependent oxidoreductase [bacterium]|nr:NAD(P)-dependent oxidoreductase [bacterium]
MSLTVLFGGSGFFGPIILEKFPEIVSIGRREPPDHLSNRHIHIDDVDDLSILDDLNIEKVIFLIGSSDHHLLNKSPKAAFDKNVYPLKLVLDYFKNRKLKKFLCFTTILLYDRDKMTLPVDEMQILAPHVNEYVFSKYISEQIAAFYEDYVPINIIRCSNIYGPTKLRRPDLVPTLIQNIFVHDIVEVWSKKPVRDFIFLEDAADAMIALLDTDFVGPVNLGTGQSASIGEITNMLTAISGKEIIDLNLNVDGPMEFRCDISLLQNLTSWRPRHTLEQGIEKTFFTMLDWHRDR